jgi:hypothetical protein
VNGRLGLFIRSAAILLAGGIAYANSLGGPFVFDDRLAIVASPNIRQWSPLSRVLRRAQESPVLYLAVWPRSLVLNYGWPRVVTIKDVWPGALATAASAACATIALMRWPKVGFFGAWFFITLAPASSVVPIATEVGAERRMYLPLAGLVVLAVVGAAMVWDRVMPNAWHADRICKAPSRPSRYATTVLVLGLVVVLAVWTIPTQSRLCVAVVHRAKGARTMANRTRASHSRHRVVRGWRRSAGGVFASARGRARG